tara:strand:- start:6248 stop:7483 length:1236 start_codon:yes stop_codon:yes gene_type:complete
MTRTVRHSTSSKPSWVRFFPSDYIAGTARMPRMVRSIYDDIMIHNFDKNRPMSQAEAMLIFGDIDPEVFRQTIENLIATDKVQMDEAGGLYIDRAMVEAGWSWEQWEAKSRGGRKGGAKGKKGGSADDIVNGDDPKPDDSTKTVAKSDDKTPTKSDQRHGTQNHSHNHNQNHIESEATASASGGGGGIDSDDEELAAVQRVIDAGARSDLIRSHMTLIPPAWNEMALHNGLKEITAVSDTRGDLIRAVVVEHDIEIVLQVIKSIPESKFLLGDNKKMGPVKFDWVMRNFGKVLDREYHDDKQATPAPAPAPVAVRELEGEPEIAKQVREFLIGKMGEDKFAYKFRGIEFYQAGGQLVVAAVSSGVAQDLIITQRAIIDQASAACGLSGVTHSSIALAKKQTKQVDTQEKEE